MASLSLAMSSAQAQNNLGFTAIAEASCGPASAEIRQRYDERDLGVEECRPAPDSIQLLFVSSDTNSWLDVVRNGVTWSTEQAIVYDAPIGLFANVGGEEVEWRGDPGGEARALIFAVTAQEAESPNRKRTRFFVLRLTPEAVCLLGRLPTVQAAWILADGPATCPAG